ncbi:MotE family protein [Falsihalocynthiibacter sp. SS001]|uniref:MotE family protein n=1 Tax=Falsihalocynthiibacter sp. SS001 TaxID=3349698 RepID=UPI0036D216E1
MSAKQPTPKRKRQTRYSLLLVAALFAMSGLLRLGTGTGAAIAREIEALGSPNTNVAEQSCLTNEGLPNLLADLKAREDRIKSQELSIAEKMHTLQIAEAKFSKNLQELVAAENALEQTILRANSASEDDLSQLTAMYENMKPKEAALLFEEMDPDFSSGFLSRMRPDAAAAVLAGLRPETAYAISVILAGRNANVPKEDS